MKDLEPVLGKEQLGTIESKPLESVDQIPLSQDDELIKINELIGEEQQKFSELSGSIEGTKTTLNKKLEELGVPTTEEDPPSVLPSKSELGKIVEHLALLEEQKEKLTALQEKKQLEGETKGIPNELLERLSDSIEVKNNLKSHVDSLKQSPDFKQFEKSQARLEEKRKRLEELKKPTNTNTDSNSSSTMNISTTSNSSGSVSLNGNISMNFENNIVENTIVGGQDKIVEEEIDLEQEAENLLAKTELEILNLQKEEIEYSPEGLIIKNQETEIELRKIDIEIDIWSTGSMDQKKFDETMSKMNNTEEIPSDFENKELFTKFKDINNELEIYKNSDENKDFYQFLEYKQSEIDGRGNIEVDFVNEGKVLKILSIYQEQNKKEESGEFMQAA